MPLVRISVHQHVDAAKRRILADAAYDAMRTAFGIPEGDRFIVVTAHGEGELFIGQDFMGMNRTEGYTLVHVTLRKGRTPELKQAFYAELTKLFGERAGIAPDDVMIVLSENESADWSFGRGEAQFLAPKP